MIFFALMNLPWKESTWGSVLFTVIKTWKLDWLCWEHWWLTLLSIKCQLYELDSIQTMQAFPDIKDGACRSSSLSAGVLDLSWHKPHCRGTGPKDSFGMRKHRGPECKNNTLAVSDFIEILVMAWAESHLLQAKLSCGSPVDRHHHNMGQLVILSAASAFRNTCKWLIKNSVYLQVCPSWS